MAENVIDTLEKRGFIAQSSNLSGLKRHFAEKQRTLYLGVDPTARSLHIGNLLPIMVLRHMQAAGHRVILVTGGGTSRIGDPSGKSSERILLSEEKIVENLQAQKGQFGRFLNFDNRSGFYVNNNDWLKKLNYIEFLRDIGRHFSVNKMLAFESYKARMERGLSFIEFNYQLLQSYDYLTLYRDYDCTLQIGGNDQWGNIVAGADLIRRIHSVEVFALTFPLLTTSDGKKMGKSEGGALYLDRELVSPYEFFQFFRNVEDSSVKKLLNFYTLLPPEEIEQMCAADINKSKEILACDITELVHGKEEAEAAMRSSRSLFRSDGGVDHEAVPCGDVSAAKLTAGIDVVKLFVNAGLVTSNSEARRLIEQGGAVINNRKINSVGQIINDEWLQNGELLLRAGKKRYFLFTVS